MGKMKLVQVTQHGNRTPCLDGCGRMLLNREPICRKCRRKNKRRVDKIELQSRKKNDGYLVLDGYDE